MKKAIQNYLAKLHDNKKDKGFSLVELIIVIAIMAILVGVVASQVLPYIEKSRKAKDLEVLNNVSSDMVTAMTDAMAAGSTVAAMSITVNSGGVSPAAGFETDVCKKYEEMKGNTTAGSYTNLAGVLGSMKSDDAKTQFTITYNTTTKELTVQGGSNNDSALKAVSKLQ